MSDPIHATPRGRFEALDGLRGIAAFVVVLHHVELLLIPGSQRLLHGYLSVDFFFVLSGFVIAGAYERQILGGMPLHRYVGKRLRRFYPLIATGILLGYGAALVGAIPAPDPTLRLLAQLVFVPALWSAQPIYMLNVVQWSLVVEVIVNVLHAVVARWLTVGRLAMVVVILMVALFGAAKMHGSLGVGWHRTNMGAGMIRGLFGFAAGVLIFRLHDAGRLPRVSLPWPLLALAIPLVVILASLPVVAWRWYADPVLVVTAMPTLVWLGAVKPLDGRAARWAFRAGALSYPLYAVQDPILHSARYLLLPATMDPVRVAIAVPVVIAIVLVVALLAMRFIDEPFQRRRPRLQTTL